MINICPFCNRIEIGEVDYIHVNPRTEISVVSFEPLNPVTDGHRLFVPLIHTEHGDGKVQHLAESMAVAERFGSDMREDYNLITSSGRAATMTVPHIHVHYVPRHEDDGLTLPWTGQTKNG